MTNISELEEKLVDELFKDLNERQGYDTGGLDEDVETEWKADWREIVCRNITQAQELYKQVTAIKDQEIESLKRERDNALKKNGEYFRLLRECKEVTYHHNPTLNIRICDALSDY